MCIQRRHVVLDSSRARNRARAASELQAVRKNLHYRAHDGYRPAPASFRVVPTSKCQRSTRSQRSRRLCTHCCTSTRAPDVSHTSNVAFKVKIWNSSILKYKWSFLFEFRIQAQSNLFRQFPFPSLECWCINLPFQLLNLIWPFTNKSNQTFPFHFKNYILLDTSKPLH